MLKAVVLGETGNAGHNITRGAAGCVILFAEYRGVGGYSQKVK